MGTISRFSPAFPVMHPSGSSQATDATQLIKKRDFSVIVFCHLKNKRKNKFLFVCFDCLSFDCQRRSESTQLIIKYYQSVLLFVSAANNQEKQVWVAASS